MYHPQAETQEKRQYVYKDTLQQIYQRLYSSGEPFIDSVGSIYEIRTKTKWVNLDECMDWYDLENKPVQLLPGEVARMELERWLGKPKIWVKKSDFRMLDIPPPNYYDGRQVDGQLYYCDLKGAYHQVYTWLTLDCAWPRGEGILPLVSVAQVLKGHKLARNAVVGITRSHSINYVKGGEYRLQGFNNPWFNPAVWRTIQSILHEIANRAIELGCFYVATDGYIFQDPAGFFSFLQYLNNAGFTYEKYSGLGYVIGWASYRVGKKETKLSNDYNGTLDNIYNERGSVEWLVKIRNTYQSPLTTDDK